MLWASILLNGNINMNQEDEGFRSFGRHIQVVNLKNHLRNIYLKINCVLTSKLQRLQMSKSWLNTQILQCKMPF